MSIPFRDIWITGGAGFVGSSLALFLRQHVPAARITCLDNLRRRGSEFNLARLKEAGIRFVHGDIRCTEDLVPEHLDLLIECSAEPSVLEGYHAPAYMVRTNFDGAVNCLELCRRSGAAFVFLSTSRVYPVEGLARLPLRSGGDRFELLEEQAPPGASARGIGEDFSLAGTRTLYGASKYAVELMAAEYAAAFGVPVLMNRCGILAGPWQMGRTDQGVITHWLLRHCWRQPLQYIGFGGSGMQVRDLLDIDDFCALLLLELQRFNDLSGQVFNAGGGPDRSLSLRELTRLARDLTGNRVEVSAVEEERPGDIPWFITDMSRLQDRLGWQPVIPVVQTLERTVRWIKDHENHLRLLL